MSAEFEQTTPEIIIDANGNVRKNEELDPLEMGLGEIRGILFTALLHAMYFPNFETEIFYKTAIYEDIITSKQLRTVGKRDSTEDVDSFMDVKAAEISGSSLIEIRTVKKSPTTPTDQ